MPSSVFCCVCFNELLQTIVDDYSQDAFLHPGDRKCVLRAIGGSGLWSLVDMARGDSEVQRLLEPGFGRYESRSQGVQESRR